MFNILHNLILLCLSVLVYVKKKKYNYKFIVHIIVHTSKNYTNQKGIGRELSDILVPLT